GEANSLRGSIGEAALASTKMKAIRQAEPLSKLPRISGCFQPRLADSIKPVTKPPRPRVTSRAPNQSMRPAVELRVSGMCHAEMATTAAARGRLMKNAQRQEACCTSQPP